MDESGYTGYDLLNSDQPVQAASSLMIDEKEAQRLVDNFFPRRQGKELKHKKLSRRPSYWNSMIELQKIILNDFMGFTYVCDKKYLLILRFLDDCVEPFFYKNGINFFKDGNDYALASLLYYAAERFWGKEQFDNLLYYYQRASKMKTIFNIDLLTDHAKSLIGNELSEILIPLSLKDDCCTRDVLNEENNTDIVFIVVLSLISHLEKYIDNQYLIIHDTSRKLQTYRMALDKLLQIKDEITFKATNVTDIIFPLKLYAVEQKDSKTSFGIQLADILVGGVVEHCKAQKGLIEKNEYNQKVIESYGDENLLFMFPDVNFEDNRQFRQKTQNFEFVDFIAKKFS